MADRVATQKVNMSNVRTSIGGLLLEAMDGWHFWMQDGVVAGNRGSDPGFLRVFNVLSSDISQPPNHEQCLDIAAKAAGTEGLPFTARILMHSVTGPFGAATFERGSDTVRVWYCNRPSGVIIGIYSCPTELSATDSYRFITNQCARIIYSAMYDRISWGAVDKLTEVQIEPPQEPIKPSIFRKDR